MQKDYKGKFYTGLLSKNNFLKNFIVNNIKNIKNILAQHAIYFSITKLPSEFVLPEKEEQKRYSAKIWKFNNIRLSLPKDIIVPKDKKIK